MEYIHKTADKESPYMALVRRDEKQYIKWCDTLLEAQEYRDFILALLPPGEGNHELTGEERQRRILAYNKKEFLSQLP